MLRSPARPIRVAHLITDLDVGGAETMLARLVQTLQSSAVENTVLSLASGGALAERIIASRVAVIELGMQPARSNVASFYRLFRLLKSLQPDVLQTWLYHADMTGLVVGTLARVPAIVWNVRCAELDPRDHPAALPLLLRMLAWASRWPSAIVFNSVAGHRAHEQLGYRPASWVIIPNGFDTDIYKPCPVARQEFRNEVGVAENAPLVGLVARAHPMKDHTTFLQAAAIAAKRLPDVQFIAAGRGVPESGVIRDLVATLGLNQRIHLLGERHDTSRVMAALDVAVSSSYSEAFPNIVGEAMACGTPPVVTDVGDSALIVGSAGRVVPPRNPAALAEAVVEILSMNPDDRRSLGLAGRTRIIEEYSLRATADRYQRLYEKLSGRPDAAGHVTCAG